MEGKLLPVLKVSFLRSEENVNLNKFQHFTVYKEGQNIIKTIKEALYIMVNNPYLNKNIGKYNLPHVWYEVLFNSWELKLN